MSAKEVLARLSVIASGSLEDFLGIPENGVWSLDLRQAKKRRKLGLVKKVKTKRETRYEQVGNEKEPVIVDHVEIELHDPLAALDKLARYHNLYKEREAQQFNLIEIAKKLKAKRDKLRRGIDRGSP